MNEVSLQFTEGINRGRLSQQNQLTSLWSLRGFRVSPTSPGQLEQLPYFYSTQFPQGTYYAGGSITEPTASSLIGSSLECLWTDYVVRIRSSGNQAQIFFQSSAPAGETIYTGLLLVINSLASFAITLGQLVDVEMTGAATFRWRKNGGGWTAGVPSTAGVSIDAGAATLYFLANAGFAGNETWSWTRTDRTYFLGTPIFQSPLVSVTHRKDVYYVGPSGQIMKQTRDATAAPVPYVISNGYRPMYGRGVTSFFDHLYVIGYTPSDVASTINSSLVVVNSDSNDYDNFISTSVNEADLYTIPDEATNTEASNNLVCCFVWNSRLFIVSDKRVYVNDYVGLPNVNDYKDFDTLTLGFQDSASRQCGYPIVAQSHTITYITGYSRIYKFAGVFEDITAPLNGTSLVFYSANYNAVRKEVILRTGSNTLMVFNEISHTWYERYSYFGNATNGCTGIFELGGELLLGTTSRRYLREDVSGLSTPVGDRQAGASFGTPLIQTQLLRGDNIYDKKEISGCYISFLYTTSGALYSVGDNARLNLKWYVSDIGYMPTSPTYTTDTNSYLLGTTTNFFVSYPRIGFRGLSLAVELEGLSVGKPPSNFILTELVPQVPRFFNKPAPTR